MKLLATMIFLATVLFAADFGHMSTEEMMQMRGSVPAEERADFQAEMQKRMQNMTPQERKKYMPDRPGMKNQQQHQDRGMQQNMMMDQQMMDDRQGMMMGGQGSQHQEGKGMQKMPPEECRQYMQGSQGMMMGGQGGQHQQGKGMQNKAPEECRKYMQGGQGRMMGGQGGQHQQGKGMKGNQPMMNQKNMNEGMKCGGGMSR